jgi:hypothetical protein
MQFSRYLRAPTMLLLLSASCFSAQGQRATVTSVSNEPLTGESLGPQIPGDLASVEISQSESQDQDVIFAHPHLGKGFWLPWIANFALMAASVELTANCLHSSQCVEADPLFGQRPSRAEMYAVKGGLLGLGLYVARNEKLKGEGFRWRFATYAILASYSLDTAHDAYETAKHSGDRNPALVANTPASRVEIISSSSSGKHE